MRIELGRISDQAARKCLNGGLAAGMLACKLEEARASTHQTFPFSSVWSALQEAERQATALRKAFNRSYEARELRDTLRAWNREFKKEARKDVLAQGLPVGADRISGLKELLGNALRTGAMTCGKGPLPPIIDRHLRDWTKLQKTEEKIQPKVSGTRRHR